MSGPESQFGEGWMDAVAWAIFEALAGAEPYETRPFLAEGRRCWDGRYDERRFAAKETPHRQWACREQGRRAATTLRSCLRQVRGEDEGMHEFLRLSAELNASGVVAEDLDAFVVHVDLLSTRVSGEELITGILHLHQSLVK
jgi:hypothetical protein